MAKTYGTSMSNITILSYCSSMISLCYKNTLCLTRMAVRYGMIRLKFCLEVRTLVRYAFICNGRLVRYIGIWYAYFVMVRVQLVRWYAVCRSVARNLQWEGLF